ncbi:unnamed protein product [Ambrosiozyma monospora]|uniref:Unnamed protein product n=1 Tax=Ambrosiozyma monospora TaxID=43982 RepID=A0ACB5T1A8_AMBMO|nr:unnamed protein product [Ambrosiozyma monospora]
MKKDESIHDAIKKDDSIDKAINKDDSIDETINKDKLIEHKAEDKCESSHQDVIEVSEKKDKESKTSGSKENSTEILESIEDSSGIDIEKAAPDSPVKVGLDPLPTEKINSVNSESTDACDPEAVASDVEKINDVESSTKDIKLAVDDNQPEPSESLSVTDPQQGVEPKLSSVSDKENSKIPEGSKPSTISSSSPEVLNKFLPVESEKNEAIKLSEPKINLESSLSNENTSSVLEEKKSVDSTPINSSSSSGIELSHDGTTTVKRSPSPKLSSPVKESHSPKTPPGSRSPSSRKLHTKHIPSSSPNTPSAVSKSPSSLSQSVVKTSSTPKKPFTVRKPPPPRTPSGFRNSPPPHTPSHVKKSPPFSLTTPKAPFLRSAQRAASPRSTSKQSSASSSVNGSPKTIFKASSKQLLSNKVSSKSSVSATSRSPSPKLSTSHSTTKLSPKSSPSPSTSNVSPRSSGSIDNVDHELPKSESSPKHLPALSRVSTEGLITSKDESPEADTEFQNKIKGTSKPDFRSHRSTKSISVEVKATSTRRSSLALLPSSPASSYISDHSLFSSVAETLPLGLIVKIFKYVLALSSEPQALVLQFTKGDEKFKQFLNHILSNTNLVFLIY